MGRSAKCYTGWWLALILAFGLGLRWYHVTDRSLWFDEAFSWRMIQYPFWEMIRRIGLDNTPPLHYLLLKYWTICFGDSLLALRSLSVLLGGLSIVAMYLFVRAATAAPGFSSNGEQKVEGRGSEPALFAALLVAISAFQIRWSWDARPYSLGAALALLSSWALLRALWAGKHNGRWWCVYVALAVLFAYTHYFALFSLAAQAGFVLFLLWKAAGGSLRRALQAPAVRQAALVYCLITLCWLPWLPIFLAQMTQVRADFWIRPFQWWDLAHIIYQMFVEPENATLSKTASLWALDLCVLGWILFVWRGGEATVYVTASALAPLGLSILLNFLGVHIFLLRYFLFAHLYFLAALALLVNRITFAIERRLLVGLLGVWALMVWGTFCETTDFSRCPGARAAADWIAQQADPHDPVVVNVPFYYLPMLYHLRQRGHCYLYWEEGAILHYDGAAVLRSQDKISAHELRTCRATRLWVVSGTIRKASALPRMDSWKLRQQQSFSEAFRCGDLIVYEYNLPTHPRPD